MSRSFFSTLLHGFLAGSCALLAAPLGAQDSPAVLSESAAVTVAEPLGESLLELPAPGIEVALSASAALFGPLSGGTEPPPPAGRWRAAPHLTLKATFDDNIFIQRDGRVSDLMLAAAPGLTVGFWEEETRRETYRDRERSAALIEKGAGDFLMLDYTAILLGFVRTSSENAVDHDARFDAQWRLEKLTLGAVIHGESKSETNVEIGNRLRRHALEVALTARYVLSEKTVFEVSGFHETREYDDFVRASEWRGESFFEYGATPLLRFSFGLAAGQVDLENGADQVFERILCRALFSLSEKVEIAGLGGVEFRQSAGAAGDRTNPIFELGISYTPAAATRLGFAGYRRVETSALRPDENLTRTGVALTVRRVVRDGLHLTLEGGYEQTDYTGGTDGDREDRYVFVRPGLLYNFAYWGNAALGYEYRHNDSSRADSTFANNQLFVEVGLSY